MDKKFGSFLALLFTPKRCGVTLDSAETLSSRRSRLMFGSLLWNSECLFSRPLQRSPPRTHFLFSLWVPLQYDSVTTGPAFALHPRLPLPPNFYRALCRYSKQQYFNPVTDNRFQMWVPICQSCNSERVHWICYSCPIREYRFCPKCVKKQIANKTHPLFHLLNLRRAYGP